MSRRTHTKNWFTTLFDYAVCNWKCYDCL